MRAPMAHFQTFARLREAILADAPALRALAATLPAGPGNERPVWSLLTEAGGAHVLVATECQLPVGAVVVWHRKDAVEARLTWLGVTLAARRRGIGSLLLESAIATATTHRAETMTVRLPADAGQLTPFLLDRGFVQEKGGSLRLPLGQHAP